MGLAGPSLGRELRALALSHTAPVPAWHRLRSQSHVTESRTDCDLTQQMVGGIKVSSPSRKSMSADMFLDLPTISAPNGEERTPRTSAQVERAGLCQPPPLQRCTARRYRACTAKAAASESLGLSVGGCPRARRYFGPRPVRPTVSCMCEDETPLFEGVSFSRFT